MPRPKKQFAKTARSSRRRSLSGVILQVRCKASIDALYGRLREARVARADRTKPVHNSRILTKRLLADAAGARKNPRGRARAGSFHITILCESRPASLARLGSPNTAGEARQQPGVLQLARACVKCSTATTATPPARTRTIRA